jgi:histidine triad (HIT) family protein
VSDCVFCEIVEARSPATIIERWADAMAIVPLHPVVDGHLIVIPYAHVRDALEVPSVTGIVAMRAAELARMVSGFVAMRGEPWPDDGPDWNLITSAGPLATQTVYHLHWHLVPRREGDGLHLPWTGQQTEGVATDAQ